LAGGITVIVKRMVEKIRNRFPEKSTKGASKNGTDIRSDTYGSNNR
jgi:hypothetical protein